MDFELLNHIFGGESSKNQNEPAIGCEHLYDLLFIT